MKTADAYSRLVARLKRIHTIYTVADVLVWDEQVNLPPGGADRRAEQNAVMAELQHREASDPVLGELLGELEADQGPLDGDQRVVLRQARRDYDRAVRLPAEFVREKAELSSRAFHAWAEARPRSDFAAFAPHLERHVELARREAGYLGWGERPYDYLIDQHDPGMSAELIGRLFGRLKEELVPFAHAVVASPVKPDTAFLRGFDVEAQRKLALEVTAALGFDYRRGRLDVSLHPFCSGTGPDIRMTTRFDADNPLDSLFSAIHESGHGMYEQGLPEEHAGTALAMAAGMGAHESQSRLWENQVARSRGFWSHFEPRLREVFRRELGWISSESLYLAVNAVAPTLIRVDSDEVTYNLHILLRFELERRLFSGDLAVRDLPRAWKQASKDLLGLEPESDREGVLQDVHWSGGAFGYFPSYCIGNMLAAQLWYKLVDLHPDLEARFAEGDFTQVLGWLRREVHAQGRRYDVLELTRRATGAELSPEPLMRYLRERYGPLYL